MHPREKLLLEPLDLKPSFPHWRIRGVLNPGGARLPDKRIVLLARVAEEAALAPSKNTSCPVIISDKEYLTGEEIIKEKEIAGKSGNIIYLKTGECRLLTLSHFRKIILDKTGFELKSIGQKPAFTGTYTEGHYGVEDPRITKFKDKYLMTYVAVSLYEGVSTALAVSKDMANWKRKGIIFREQNKDAVIFPEKIKGKFCALHRPEGFFEFSRPSIWISYSPDLVYWGKEESIIQPRPNSWESERIGAGTVPIKMPEGWLEIYHGVKKEKDQKIYSAGTVLLDLKHPEHIIARSPANKPLFSPKESYEKTGFINNVVFPTTAIPDLNKKDLLIYSGAADTSITVRKISIKEIFNNMEWNE